MKEILNRLTQHETLQKEEASSILFQIAKGAYNPSQIASFLTVFMMRSITLEELEGFREALLELCVAIDLSEFTPIDLCGTGGDGKDTFNISTLSSFITAGAGVKVAKHGNYGVSSGCSTGHPADVSQWDERRILSMVARIVGDLFGRCWLPSFLNRIGHL